PPQGAAGRAPESSKTLDRGVQLLEVLARPGHASGLPITELATELGVGRPAVDRGGSAFGAQHRGASRPNGRVRLGAGGSGRAAVRLAAASPPVVRRAARPLRPRLADAAGAPAHLPVAAGQEALALVVGAPTWTDFHVAYRSGARHPLERGAAGRAILEGRAG